MPTFTILKPPTQGTAITRKNGRLVVVQSTARDNSKPPERGSPTILLRIDLLAAALRSQISTALPILDEKVKNAIIVANLEKA